MQSLIPLGRIAKRSGGHCRPAVLGWELCVCWGAEKVGEPQNEVFLFEDAGVGAIHPPSAAQRSLS